jgi:hypothetical protein
VLLLVKLNPLPKLKNNILKNFGSLKKLSPLKLFTLLDISLL